MPITVTPPTDNIGCFGQATFVFTGTPGPYVLIVPPTLGTISVLSANTYTYINYGVGGADTFTVQDVGTLETAVVPVTITCTPGPGTLSLTPSVPFPTPLNCGDSITVIVSGGIAPYTWGTAALTPWGTVVVGGPGNNTLTFTLTVPSAPVPRTLAFVEVLDSTAPSPLNVFFGVTTNCPLDLPTLSASINPIICGIPSVITALSGNAPFTWSAVAGPGVVFTLTPAGATASITGAQGTGSITVTVTDANGDTASITVLVNCGIVNCGTPIVVPGQGVAPYTFTAVGTPGLVFTFASTPLAGTVTGVSGSGIVTVTITDSLGAISTVNVSLSCTVPPLLADFPINTVFDCGGINQIIVSGGIAPYTYTPNGCPVGITTDIFGNVTVPATIPNGACSIIVSDTSGQSVEVPLVWGCLPPQPLQALTPAQDALCGTDVSLGIAGGTGPYTWAFVPAIAGVLNVDIDGLNAIFSIAPTFVGTVSFTVTDSTLPIPQIVLMDITVICPPTPLVVDQPSVRINCGDTFTITVSGGTAPYTWTSNCGLNVTIAPLVGPTISGTAIPGFAGNCQLTVTDAAGQTSVVGVTVLCDNDLPRIVAGGGILLCNETRTLFASGGTAPYTWSAPCPALLTLGVPGPLGASIPVTSNTTNGTCTITLTDANGLTDTITVTVICNAPNLVATHYCVACNGTQQINVLGGTAPYVYAVASDDCGGQCPPGSTVSPTGLFTAAGEAGACFVRVTDADGNVLYIPVIIVCPPVIVLPPLFPDFVIPPLLTMTPEPATVECGNLLQFIVVGGVPPYTFRRLGCVNMWGEPLGTITAGGLFSATPFVSGTCFIEVTDFAGRKAVSIIRVTCAPPCNDCVNCPPVP